MRRVLLAFGLITGTLLALGGEATACGDKFTALARGIRFGQFASARPANILIYASAGSRMPLAERQQLQSFLKQVGHKPDIVADPNALGTTLQIKQYDVVLADLSDAATLQRQFGASPSKPVVFPVLSKPTKAEETAATKQYSFVVKPSTKIGQFLAAIDRVTKSRSGKVT